MATSWTAGHHDRTQGLAPGGSTAGGGWGRGRPTRCRWGAGGDAFSAMTNRAGRILIHAAPAPKPPHHHGLMSKGDAALPADLVDRRGQPAHALVDLVGGHRREGQPQRVLAAL